jgi:exosortase/archaeosortase family protein
VIVGIIVIQFFNVFRIGILVVLRDIGGDVYFFFIKYVFNVLIYLAILLLWLLKPYLDKIMHNNVS